MLAISHPDKLIGQIFEVLKASPDFEGDIADSLDALAGMTGLTMPDDLAGFLGSAAVLSVGNLPAVGDPQVSLRTRPMDVDQAKDIAEMLADLLSSATNGAAQVDVQRKDSDLLLTFGAERQDKGRLLDDATFRRAVGDLPDALVSAAYVDLRKVWKLQPDVPRDLKAITAVGFMSGMDGSDLLTRIRVVADR
jgi:hypothetical protein